MFFMYIILKFDEYCFYFAEKESDGSAWKSSSKQSGGSKAGSISKGSKSSVSCNTPV